MNDFPYLLVRAASSMGTVLDVALALQVRPLEVYRWIAGCEVPGEKQIGELKARLEGLTHGQSAAAGLPGF